MIRLTISSIVVDVYILFLQGFSLLAVSFAGQVTELPFVSKLPFEKSWTIHKELRHLYRSLERYSILIIPIV